MSKQSIINELRKSFMSVNEQELDVLCNYILAAPKIFVYSRGRVFLALKALSIRLNQLGITARAVGDITIPFISKDDLLIVGSPLGFPSSVDRYIKIAKNCGAKVIAVTSNPKGPLWVDCDGLVTINARAYTSHPEVFDKAELSAGEKNAVELLNIPSEQPMGTSFEQLIVLTMDYLILKLQRKLNQNENQLRARHANLL